ncbi:MAG: hypothetical protein ACRC2T_18895 [Thermoguttaceae bacterium]
MVNLAYKKNKYNQEKYFPSGPKRETIMIGGFSFFPYFSASKLFTTHPENICNALSRKNFFVLANFFEQNKIKYGLLYLIGSVWQLKTYLFEAAQLLVACLNPVANCV